MALTVGTLLLAVAFLLTVVSFFDNRYPLVNTALLLVIVGLLVR